MSPQTSPLAMLKTPSGVRWAAGEMAATEAPPGGGKGSFYVNDFWLSDPKPWKTPAEGLLDEGPMGRPGGGLPEVAWEGADREVWGTIFQDAHSLVERDDVSKVVPVIEATGVVGGSDGDDPAGALLSRAAEAGEGLWGYGFDDGAGGGFAGASPEVFLHVRGDQAEAMALAGSAAPGGWALGDDAKERVEHSLVADDIEATLGRFGEVERGGRELLDLGDIRHLMTRVRCRISDLDEGGKPDYGALVRSTPTPAVGSAPRSRVAVDALRSLREGRCPEAFGAPFGVLEGDEFFAVLAIRGVFWEGALAAGSRISLPAGCGIVAGSTCDREWEELALKRATVRTFFGL